MFSNSHDILTSADVNRKELLCIIIPHLKELSENLIVISLRMRTSERKPVDQQSLRRRYPFMES